MPFRFRYPRRRLRFHCFGTCGRMLIQRIAGCACVSGHGVPLLRKASGRVAPDDAPPRDHFICFPVECAADHLDLRIDMRVVEKVEIAQAVGSHEFDVCRLLTQLERCGADKLATDRLLQRVRYREGCRRQPDMFDPVEQNSALLMGVARDDETQVALFDNKQVLGEPAARLDLARSRCGPRRRQGCCETAACAGTARLVCRWSVRPRPRRTALLRPKCRCRKAAR